MSPPGRRRGAIAQESRFGGPAPRRASVVGHEAMVASAHPAASLTGARVLADGGNAIDAALAMAAVTAVLLPAQCGVGGDAFALVRNGRSGAVTAIQGSGYPPDGADLDFFLRAGHRAIPLTGPLSVTVPGWVSAVDALHARGATRPLAALFAPAIALARRGAAVSAKNAVDLASSKALLATDDATAAIFLPGGRPPREGDRLVQADLATTLETVASDPAAFYRGALAERIVATLRARGAPFSGDEWAAEEALVTAPLTARYGTHDVHTTTLPTPGYMILEQALVAEEALSRAGLLDAAAVAAFAGAAGHAFAGRVADVGSDNDAWRARLSPESLSLGKARLSRGEIPVATLRRDGDTTSFVVVDAENNAVSFIHSLAFTFGSGVMAPGTGVLLNDRLGRGAYLVPDHANAVKARRRPMHTLCAWIATRADGALAAVGNTPGGDGQVQWNVQVLSHLLDHGLDPQDAVDAPRITLVPGSDANVLGAPLEVECESRLGADVLAALATNGVPVSSVGPWAGGGGAQVVAVRDGALFGASDSRQDGNACGL